MSSKMQRLKEARMRIISQGGDEFDLHTLIPNDKNPRRIAPSALQFLKESIERDPEFMSLRPIVVDESLVILGGNQRYRACMELGKRMVPASWVRQATGLTEEQRRRFVLLDNAPEGVSGYWDFNVLTENWEEPELVALGFSFPEDVNHEVEWQGMPEFIQENVEKKVDSKEGSELRVIFSDQAGRDAFSKLVGQNIGKTAKSIYYPKKDQNQLNRGKEYREK